METVENRWPYAAALREVRGELSVERAARRIGMARAAWEKWERGDRVPAADSLRRIVEEFEVPPAVIGYQPPAGWEFVPAEWITHRLDQQDAALRHLQESVDALLNR